MVLHMVYQAQNFRKIFIRNILVSLLDIVILNWSRQLVDDIESTGVIVQGNTKDLCILQQSCVHKVYQKGA